MALLDGRVDAAIKRQDIDHEWMNFYEHDPATGEAVPMIGTFVPRDLVLCLRPVDVNELRRAWQHLISVRGPYASDPPHSHDPRLVRSRFETALFGSTGPLGDLGRWRHWSVRPDFLNGIDAEGRMVNEDGLLCCFEPDGTNLAWFGLSDSHFVLLVVNAYPGFDQSELDSVWVWP